MKKLILLITLASCSKATLTTTPDYSINGKSYNADLKTINKSGKYTYITIGNIANTPNNMSKITLMYSKDSTTISGSESISSVGKTFIATKNNKILYNTKKNIIFTGNNVSISDTFYTYNTLDTFKVKIIINTTI